MANRDDEQSLKKLVEVLYGILFFNIFSEEELRTILKESRLIKWKKIARGARIFTEGSFDQHFYVIISGMVDIRKNKGNRQAITVGNIRRGEILGEMVVCDPEKPRKASAYASEDEDTVVCEIDATLIQTVPEDIRKKFLKKFLDLIIARFRQIESGLKYYDEIIKNNDVTVADDFFKYTLETAVNVQNRLTQLIKYTDFLIARKLDSATSIPMLLKLIVNAKNELDQSVNYCL